MNQATSHSASGRVAPPPACWSCRADAGTGSDLFCAACGAVQPPGAADHFARLGLPRCFAIDLAELDRRYFALQRQLHPDRFVRRAPRERAISQSQAASLNEAYETLRDPLSRAVYLLRLQGVELEPPGGQTISDPDLLMEAMEMREALAEAGDAASVAVLARRIESERAAALTTLATAFAAGARDAARKAALRLKYLGKLAEDIRARRAAPGATAAKAVS
ncbi:MAG: Fe-S protein assembly co-chaperone HscB [Alphaproteobacteria bacterium]|nr:Fe-S protein assembly co-chaperone HscB [Alphaproteobacteria bacterium]